MKQQIIIVSGANNGIGLALTEMLVSYGHKVAAIDLTGENLTALVQSRPDLCSYYACDVTDPRAVQTSIEAVVTAWGRIDILVNNACLAVFASFEQKSLDETRREFEVNYFGYINIIQAALPVMKVQGNGFIHNVSSGVGLTGFAGLYGCASTKGAIEALTRTLAIEFRPYGIIVNLIHPPLTRTKSASPLGVPEKMMADPKIVGQKLARKIGQRSFSITPDFSTVLGLFANRHIPDFMGNLLVKMTERAHRAIIDL